MCYISNIKKLQFYFSQSFFTRLNKYSTGLDLKFNFDELHGLIN